MAGLKTVKRSFSEPVVRRSVLRILRSCVLCSISTVAPPGRAHVNTAYFAFSPRMEVVFLSDPGSLHARNLARNPSAAIAVFDSRQTWGKPDRGIQMFGRCAQAEGPRALDAERLYGGRFPEYRRILRGATLEDRASASQLRTYRFYRFVPSTVKVLDEKVFGGGVFVIASIPSRRRAPGRAGPRRGRRR